jgi:hypothetical protein
MSDYDDRVEWCESLGLGEWAAILTNEEMGALEEWAELRDAEVKRAKLARNKAERERDEARELHVQAEAQREAADAERDALRAEVERLRARLDSVLDSGIVLAVAGGHRASELAFREKLATLRREGER